MFVRDREGKRAVGRDGPWSEDVPQSQILEDYREFNETCKRLVKVGSVVFLPLPSSLCDS